MADVDHVGILADDADRTVPTPPDIPPRDADPYPGPMRRRLLLGFVLGAGLTGLAALAALAVAFRWTPLGEAGYTHLDRTLHAHERLHFMTHLAAGRALSVCPCTRNRAAMEHWKAARHAPTPRERALATVDRPRHLADVPGDLAALARYGLWVALTSPTGRLLATLPAIALTAGGGLLLAHRRPKFAAPSG